MSDSPKSPNPSDGSAFPSATYRLQLNAGFPFLAATPLTDYFHNLGITHLYASPFLRARKGSLHGYDVVDPSVLNEEIGTEAEFTAWTAALKKMNMGLILDIVPNHMCITEPSNRWWYDVLENGPSSPYAAYFDVDWQPLKVDLANKVLLPILGDQYGKVLENQQIRISYDQGAFRVDVYDRQLPAAPRSWMMVLEMVLRDLKENAEYASLLIDLESIMTAIRHLPLQTETESEKVRERQREKEVIKKRLAEWVDKNPAASGAIERTLAQLNGQKGNPRSFDTLEGFLNEQAYRLCFWRVATDEINYRRFFDINELAAIRVEVPQVFQSTHQLPLRWIKEGKVSGFRIDHVDGLYDPVQYLNELRTAAETSREKSGCYIVVEKILETGEKLMPDWPVQGTTGYDFLNQLNGLFIDPDSGPSFLRLYQEFTGVRQSFSDILATSKKLIMLVSNASELRVLSNMMDRISEQHRWSRDFTMESLRFALREVIAYFPVYRTYLRPGETQIETHDRHVIERAIREAKRHNPSTDSTIFDFIRSVLLLEDPEGIDEAQKLFRRHFVMKFQQLTGPIMAKGMEDTAFYRYYPLASLNEVGGRPDQFGLPLSEFHRINADRARRWPFAMLATTTHDTKRSEDVRARINVLSEMPAKWYRSVVRWSRWHEPYKTDIDGVPAPDRNQEYLLYQTLVGTWPMESAREILPADYPDRIKNYMIKAAREAKSHTSWIKSDEQYERALTDFVERVLSTDSNNKFISDFLEFVKPVQKAGFLNSLTQVLLKICSPGVPDFYQGTETLNFRLVDPDNRNPVNYEELKTNAADINNIDLESLLASPNKGRLKEYVTTVLLRFRRKNPELFTVGEYLPLDVKGPRSKQVCAFARRHGDKTVLVVSGRFYSQLEMTDISISGSSWEDVYLELPSWLPAGNWRDILSGKTISISAALARKNLPIKQVFATLPISLLEAT